MSKEDLVLALKDNECIEMEDMKNKIKYLERENKELRNDIDLLSVTSKAAEFVLSSLDIDFVLRSILIEATKLVETPGGSIALFDKKRSMLTIKASFGFSKKFMDVTSWNVRKGGATEFILNSKSPIVVSDTSKDIKFDNPIVLKENIKAMIAIPLTVHHDVIGVLYLDDFKKRSFKKENIDALSILATYAALAIKNAQLHSELDASYKEVQTYKKGLEETNYNLTHQVSELSLLLDVAHAVVSSLKLDEVLNLILEGAKHITDMPAGSIALLEDNNSEMVMKCISGFSNEFEKTRRWKVREMGVTKLILKETMPVIISDTKKEKKFNNPTALKEGIRSLIAVPLSVKGKHIGILYVDDFKPRKFSDSLIKTLDILANHAALAIQNAMLHEQTRIMAVTDGLTGLYNHQYLHEKLDTFISLAKRYAYKISFIILDVDDFKKLNDEYGHQKGDVVLKEIAGILKEICRDVDIVTRYGGEEFAIILPYADKAGVCRIAGRICKSVKKHNFKLSRTTINKVTISIGTSTYPENAKRGKTLISRADNALYKAKRDGKDRVVSA